MIDKQAEGNGTVRVSFRVPAAYDALAVLGDFNDWDPQRTLFQADGDCRVASAILRPGRRYLFRYVTRTGAQCNDEAADDYQADPAGAYRGVLDLTGTGLSGQRDASGAADPPGFGEGPHDTGRRALRAGDAAPLTGRTLPAPDRFRTGRWG